MTFLRFCTAPLVGLLLSAGLLALSACKKDKPDTPRPTVVYAVGNEFTATRISKGVVWKNGTATALSDGTTGALGLGIAVVGRDVYVAGSGVSALRLQAARYWKNGTPVSLGGVIKAAYVGSIALGF